MIECVHLKISHLEIRFNPSPEKPTDGIGAVLLNSLPMIPKRQRYLNTSFPPDKIQ
jgi:hypothetical protein